MKPGNEIEHLANEARTNGKAETSWAMLRNAYFRGGTPVEAFKEMKVCFAGMGIQAISEIRIINGRQVEMVVLTPIRRPRQSAHQAMATHAFSQLENGRTESPHVDRSKQNTHSQESLLALAHT